MQEERDVEPFARQRDHIAGRRKRVSEHSNQESQAFSSLILARILSAGFIAGCAVLIWLGVLLIFPGFSEDMSVVSDQISLVTRTDFASPLLGILLVLIAVAGVLLALRQFKFFTKILYSPRNVEVSVYDNLPLDSQLIQNLRIQIAEIQAELMRREGDIARKPSTLSKKAMDNLERTLKQELTDKLNDEFLSQRFEKYISDVSLLASGSANSRTIEMQERALRRLGIQVEVLGARANRALSFGIFFATLGLITMYLVLFDAAPSTAKAQAALTAPAFHFLEVYLPRFTLVLLIEIVAFFFLRLYARTLSELRYVQNETTNVEFRFIGFNASATPSITDVRVDSIKNFLSTERNNIIDSNQTTVEIAREKLALETEASTIKNLSELLHGKDKGWLWKSRE